MIPTNSAPQKEVSPLTNKHINDTECFRLDDRVLDAFFLGLPGRCRRKTRCSAFNFDALCQRINEATQKKKRSCCNLPKQPLLELLAGPPSHFVSDVFFWDFASLPFHQQQIQQTCVFPMCFTRWLQKSSQQKKKVPQPWALAFTLNGISAPSWHLNRTQVFMGQMLCFTILEKQRNVGTNTWPKRHRFHGSPNDFCSYYLAICPFKSVTKAATGRWTYRWKTWIKSLIHISAYQSNIGLVKCASTSGSMIRCWGCYASVPLLKELASLPQHLTCRIFVEKRLSAEKSPPPFPCWDFWMVSPLKKNKTKKGSQQQNMINLNRFTFHKIQHLIAGKNAWKEAFFPAFPFFRFRLIFAHRFKQFLSWGTPKNHPPRYLQLAPLSRLGPTSAERKFFTESNRMETQNRMISF